jgi:hypothetical protein
MMNIYYDSESVEEAEISAPPGSLLVDIISVEKFNEK